MHLKSIICFINDETGATAIEYGLMALLIALTSVASFNFAGGEVEKLYASVVAAFD